MKKRFFYLADIATTFTIAPMTKKEIISIGQELKELCEFMSHDQTISGYTKAGEFFYYDCSNFDSFKKSDIINAVSVIYSDESGDYYWGGFDINEWGVANPTEDGTIIIADHENIKEVSSFFHNFRIADHENIKEVENADYTEEDQETEEPAEVAAEEPEAVQKTSYTVINTITGMFYGTYRNKRDALKRRTWARKYGRERNSKYNVHVIKNYVEVNYGDDPNEIEKINRANIVTY